MHRISVSFAVAIALAVTALAAARGPACMPPVNEDCEGAFPFSSDDLPYEILWVLGCTNDVVDKPYRDVFFRYDCTVTRDHTLDMCDSSGDTFIRIYTGACGWSGGREFATADDECPGSPPNADPLLTVPLEAGTTYWIELGTWRPDPPWAPEEPNAPIVLNVRLEAEPCPADLTGVDGPDGAVGFADLTLLLSSWGRCAEPCAPCAGDLDGDCTVGFTDLTTLLGSWGPCV
jgi:hypothetical protein